ncbi:MAG: PhoH family protein [Candidatus Moranbacteria bacterium]|nr:PhoH family protein [Candidatus Moranbacteria bacterium]
MAARKKTKHFILDTNVLIHDPDAFREFGDNTVVICEEVLEELDSLKKRSDDTDGSVSASARKASNGLAEFLGQGDVRKGVKMPNRGTLVIPLDSSYPLKFNKNAPDNRILSFAYGLSRENGKRVSVISKDTNVRLKAAGLGLDTEDYTKDQSELFRKYGSVFEGGDEKPNGILSIRYQIRGGEIWRFCGGDDGRTIRRKRSVMGIFPRNGEQECALDALSCPDIEAVALSGIAGTGKTFLALLVGISQTTKKDPLYERIIVARPPVTVGNKNSDIGYFPGDKEEKLMNWMQPIRDNLEVILKNVEPEEGKFRKKFAEKDNHVVLTLEKLLSSGKLELESIGHIRGRSLSKTFIIIDEAQNTRPLDVKTLITRCGEGSKIVFCGDLGQIDAPYLDSSSSGLAHLIDRFKDDENFCHLRLEQGLRSRLADKAARLL